MDNRRTIGTLLFVGGAQFAALLTVAETQYPGYSVANNYISDLGIWAYRSAYVFNPSVALLGVFTLLAGYLVYARVGWRIQGAFQCVSGAGAVGVGLFDYLTGLPHILFAFLAFFFGALAAIAYFRRLGQPMGLIGALLGGISLLALTLFGAGLFLGLGAGGMERMILYPQMAFTLGLGGYFLAGLIR